MATVKQRLDPTVPVAPFLAVELTLPVLTAAQNMWYRTHHTLYSFRFVQWTPTRDSKARGSVRGDAGGVDNDVQHIDADTRHDSNVARD